MAKESSGGIGLEVVLFVVFLVLKLVGVITWSWWWVTSPLWIGVLILLFTLFLVKIFSDSEWN